MSIQKSPARIAGLILASAGALDSADALFWASDRGDGRIAIPGTTVEVVLAPDGGLDFISRGDSPADDQFWRDATRHLSHPWTESVQLGV